MQDDEIITLRVSRRDAGRLMGLARRKRVGVEQGLAKFADNFDPVLGKTMIDSRDAYRSLEASIKEQMK